MKFLTSLFTLALASMAVAQSCSTPEGNGVCKSTSSCGGFSVPGHCPGASNIQCCVSKTCSTPEGSGTCKSVSGCSGMSIAGHCPGSSDIQCCVGKSCSTSKGKGTCKNTSKSCGGGAFIAGACPGDSSIECCVPGATPPPSTGGAGIVNAAMKERGIPYVWGGGGCGGESKGGFDCSGLTQFSVCQAEHKTIPRTAQEQYHSSIGKRYPRSQAKEGDLLFWGTNGDCVNSVVHTGIFIRPGLMINAARPGTVVKEENIWTSSGGEVICPDVVRFW